MTAAGAPGSLRGRLVLLLAIATVAVWASAAFWAYLDSRQEISRMMDAQLAQSAAILHAQAGHELDEMVVDEIGTGHKYERKIAFQIWDRKGRLVLHSRGAPETPLHEGGAGFADVSIGGKAWRVFALRDAGRGLTVQVGERRELREELAADAARHLLHPMLFALPMLGILIWLAVTRGLEPLRRAAQDVSGRSRDHLAPLPAAGAPHEVRPLLDALNALFARVRSTMDRERRFTADAAHELRTPLAAIKTQAQVAQAAGDPRSRGHALDQVVAGADRATHLVAQLLTLARLDPQDGLPETTTVDLGRLARELLAELGPLALAKRIDVELDAAPSCTVDGDPTMLSILLRNLVDNAMRYTQRGGSLRVRVGAGGDGTGAWLEVQDNGPGIPSSQRDKVLERFYRIEGSGESGSGLGLSIAQRIVELHRAKLELLDAVPGPGLRARVTFPARTVNTCP
jgi:two-component system sensor histidine kinase QseC